MAKKQPNEFQIPNTMKYIVDLLQERSANSYKMADVADDAERPRYNAQDMIRNRVIGLPFPEPISQSVLPFPEPISQSVSPTEKNKERVLTADQELRFQNLKAFQQLRLKEIEMERIEKENKVIQQSAEHLERKINNKFKKTEKKRKLDEKIKRENEYTNKKVAIWLSKRKKEKVLDVPICQNNNEVHVNCGDISNENLSLKSADLAITNRDVKISSSESSDQYRLIIDESCSSNQSINNICNSPKSDTLENVSIKQSLSSFIMRNNSTATYPALQTCTPNKDAHPSLSADSTGDGNRAESKLQHNAQYSYQDMKTTDELNSCELQDDNNFLASLLDVVIAYPASAKGAAALGLLCAHASVVEEDVLGRLLHGRTIVLTEAGRMALAAAKQQDEPLIPKGLQSFQEDEGIEEITVEDETTMFDSNTKKKCDLEKIRSESLSEVDNPSVQCTNSNRQTSSVSSTNYLSEKSNNRCLKNTIGRNRQDVSEGISLDNGADFNHLASPHYQTMESDTHKIVCKHFNPPSSTVDSISSSSSTADTRTSPGRRRHTMSMSPFRIPTMPSPHAKPIAHSIPNLQSTTHSMPSIGSTVYNTSTAGTGDAPFVRWLVRPPVQSPPLGAGTVEEETAAASLQEHLDTGQNNHLTSEEFAILNGDGNGPIMMQLVP